MGTRYMVINKHEEVLEFSTHIEAKRYFESEQKDLGPHDKITFLIDADHPDDYLRHTVHGVYSFIDQLEGTVHERKLKIQRMYIFAKWKRTRKEDTQFLRDFIEAFENNLLETGPNPHIDYAKYFVLMEGH